jgi:leucyl-tRNA synthetase
MIQGRSNFVYRIKDTNTFVSFGLKDKYDTTQIHVDVNIVKNDVLDLEAFKAWRPEFNTAEFILEDDKYICGWAVEKMSKSMFNVVNPDMIVERYGADTLRLYEMFLGPLEQSKPWDTNGIDGCHRFLKKLWQLFWDKDGNLQVEDAEPSADNMKTLHKLIKKVSADIEEFSFNTSISAFMVATNELTAQKCHNREVLKQMVTLLAPFAPHMAEELWEAIVGEGSVCDAQWPAFDEKYLVEASVQLGVQFNGKVRFSMQFPSEATPEEMIQMATSAPEAQKYLEGKQIVKAIAIPKRIVNIVIK